VSKFFLYFKNDELPATFEDGERKIAAFQAWRKEVADHIVSSGSPMRFIGKVTPEGVSVLSSEERSIYGFTIIEADSVQDVVELTRNCPILWSGEIEIAEFINMDD
jgi:hypothetical protein